ncbi:hypothetical protein [Longimicrobium sp.]|jgi:hypothetical protein|uniref:hypothetical protein n=1 Tax=Longimicrobium sp. TaxID=2029185 RepID=UPI002EDA07C0
MTQTSYTAADLTTDDDLMARAIAAGANTTEEALAYLNGPFQRREVPAAEVTAQMIATDRDFVVITPTGRLIGDKPSLSFGLGSWDGDTEGFAEWLRTQP